MALHIIIDGYNLIRQSSYLAAVEREDMQAGREALIDMLASYKKVRSHRITVVFDGAEATVGMPRRDQLKGIRMQYSTAGVLADTVIKRMAAREKEGALVVSSDRDILEHARASGAAIIDSGDFETRLVSVLYETGEEDSGDSGEWKPTTKKKGPSRRLSKKQRRNRRKAAKL